MSRRSVLVWCWVHKWTSLICTVFLLMLCVTGLPLIFHDEIDSLSGDPPLATGLASSGNGPGLKSLDSLVALAKTQRAGEVPVFMAFDNEGPVTTVTTAPAPDSVAAQMTVQLFDRATGAATGEEDGGGVMHFLLQLHTDMFLGLPGMLFLGVMGVLFVLSLVSGAVLYAPFMRKLDFGTLRRDRSVRTKWLDYHNLLGIVALAWTLVVGLTGVINAFADPIVGAWRATELTDMTKGYRGLPPLPPAQYGSVDTAMAAARTASPGTNPQFIAFPGGAFSTPHHYAIFMQGTTPLTERLLTAILIDARTGSLTDIRPMPWYVQALLLSQPLHFGDYGGLPLKILWSLLDIATIVVLGSGVYLWLRPRRGAATPLDEFALREARA